MLFDSSDSSTSRAESTTTQLQHHEQWVSTKVDLHDLARSETVTSIQSSPSTPKPGEVYSSTKMSTQNGPAVSSPSFTISTQ